MVEKNTYTPNCDVFPVGSYPYKNAEQAVRYALKHTNVLPHWPQLPKKSVKEKTLEQTKLALARADFSFAKGSAAGWASTWRYLGKKPPVKEYFKTQLIGPITLFGKATAEDAEYKNWLTHMSWQISEIQKHGLKPIVVLDEPKLPSCIGTPKGYKQTLKFYKALVKKMRTMKCLVGIHCCNRVSPKFLIETGADLIHFDAFHFQSLINAARQDLQDYIREGGIVAWGMIPAQESLDANLENKIEKKFYDLLASLESIGRESELSYKKVLAQSMIAPTCGTGLVGPQQGERVIQFTTKLSARIKRRYRLS